MHFATVPLGEIRDQAAVEPLIQSLGDENSLVKGIAAEALGKIGDVRATQPLVSTLRDENSWVRGVTAEALDKIGFQPQDPLIERIPRSSAAGLL